MASSIRVIVIDHTCHSGIPHMSAAADENVDRIVDAFQTVRDDSTRALSTVTEFGPGVQACQHHDSLRRNIVLVTLQRPAKRVN